MIVMFHRVDNFRQFRQHRQFSSLEIGTTSFRKDILDKSVLNV